MTSQLHTISVNQFKDRPPAINIFIEMNTNSTDRPSTCKFIKLCFDGLSVYFLFISQNNEMHKFKIHRDTFIRTPEYSNASPEITRVLSHFFCKTTPVRNFHRSRYCCVRTETPRNRHLNSL